MCFRITFSKKQNWRATSLQNSKRIIASSILNLILYSNLISQFYNVRILLVWALSAKFHQTNFVLASRIKHGILSMTFMIGAKLLTRLRLNFSQLNQHKFRHNFMINISLRVHVVQNKRQHFTTTYPAIFTLLVRLERLNDIYALSLSFKTILKIIS